MSNLSKLSKLSYCLNCISTNKSPQQHCLTISFKGLVKCEKTFYLFATAVPIKPFDPNTVTTSPEKEERPPRPRFIEAVFRALPGLTYGARGVRHVCQALGPSSSEGQWCRTDLRGVVV